MGNDENRKKEIDFFMKELYEKIFQDYLKEISDKEIEKFNSVKWIYQPVVFLKPNEPSSP